MLHKYIFDGTRIVIDVNSGAVHVLDQISWDILECVEQITRNNGCGRALGRQDGMAGQEAMAGRDAMTGQDDGCPAAVLADPGLILERLRGKYPEPELREAAAELLALHEAGQLFSADTALEEIKLPQGNPLVKSLCLHIAHDCNLRCRYCFASTGRFGGQRELMSAEVGRAALDFLLEASGSRKNCEVDFFGGEPLLNFPVVQELVAYGREQASKKGKVFKFTLTTNAVLLDEKVEQWLNEQDIAVVLSLDGRPAVNDQMRPFPDGKGCYGTIVPNIVRFTASRGDRNYYVRGTYTAHNCDFSEDVRHMADLGLTQLSVEPVVAPEDKSYAFTEEHLPGLFAEYDKLTRLYLERRAAGRPFDFFHFNLDLSRGPCIAKRLSGCGAGHEYLAVSPQGDLYPCHQFVGREGFLVGNVFARQLNVPLMKKFRQAHIYNKPKCRECWARFYCSGGCHANAEAANGDILQPQDQGCQLERKRLECAIYIQLDKAGII